MRISDLVMTVDVPDRVEEYTNREIAYAPDGLTIFYADDSESKVKANFIKPKPHVLVTPYDTNAYPNVLESERGYCVVKLYTNEGIETTGAVNITVSGY